MLTPSLIPEGVKGHAKNPTKKPVFPGNKNSFKSPNNIRIIRPNKTTKENITSSKKTTNQKIEQKNEKKIPVTNEAENNNKKEADKDKDIVDKSTQTGMQASFFIVALVLSVLRDVCTLASYIPVVGIVFIIINVILGIIYNLIMQFAGRNDKSGSTRFVMGAIFGTAAPINTLTTVLAFTGSKEDKNIQRPGKSKTNQSKNIKDKMNSGSKASSLAKNMVKKI